MLIQDLSIQVSDLRVLLEAVLVQDRALGLAEEEGGEAGVGRDRDRGTGEGGADRGEHFVTSPSDGFWLFV